MYWTEQQIKEVLDGTFTRVLSDGRSYTEIVSDDFVPYEHKGGRPLGAQNVKPQRFWTKYEEDLLATLRLRNKPFNEIAWVLDRTEDSCKKRYKVLRARGAA